VAVSAQQDAHAGHAAPQGDNFQRADLYEYIGQKQSYKVPLGDGQ
jgi:hypothetical protein